MADLPDWTTRTAPRDYLGALNQPLEATEAGAQLAVIGGVAGQRIVLAGWNVSPDPTAGSATVLRDWVMLEAWDAVTASTLARVALSPQSPLGVAPILDGAAQADIGSGVSVTATSRHGSGNQGIVFDLFYYLV